MSKGDLVIKKVLKKIDDRMAELEDRGLQYQEAGPYAEYATLQTVYDWIADEAEPKIRHGRA